VRSDKERLEDMLAAVDKILAESAGAQERFAADPMLQVWVLHHLQIVGEAARTLSSGFRQKHPDKAWAKAAGLRHILVHHYFEIDHSEIWRIVEQDLPSLRDRVSALLTGGVV
jgi:uncharacterized protein with HEPN domain